MKGIRIDFRAISPIYIQIVEQIRQQLAASDLQPGDQLPTVRQLASELRVNFNTIARSYRILDEAGLISTQQGRGTYILDEPDPEVVAHIRQHSLQELTAGFIEDASQLGFSASEIMQSVTRGLMDKSVQDKGEE